MSVDEDAAVRKNIVYVSVQHGAVADGHELFKLRIFSLVRDAPGVFTKLSKLVLDAAIARKVDFERIDFYSDGYALPTEEIFIENLVQAKGHVTAHVLPRAAACQVPFTPAQLRNGDRLCAPRSGDTQPAKQAKRRFGKRQTATQAAAAATRADMLYNAQTACFSITG